MKSLFKMDLMNFFLINNDDQQKLLSSTHMFKWIHGSLDHDDLYDNEKIFLTETQKYSIRNMNTVVLFEILFEELK